MNLLVAALSLAVAATPAEVAKAEALMNEGFRLLNDGFFEEAQRPLLEATARWKKLGPKYEPDWRAAQNNLATAYRRQGKVELAIPILEEVVAAAGKVKGPDKLWRTRVALNNLGMAYKYANRSADARRVLDRAIGLAPSGPPDEELARELDNLANILIEDSDFMGAAPLLRRSTAAWLALRGRDDLDYGIAVATLGTLEMRQKLPGARGNLGEALRIVEKSLGPEHPEVSALLNLLGELEVREGHREAARKHFLRSLTIAEKALLPDHPQLLEARAGVELTAGK